MMRQMLAWVLLAVALANECCCEGYLEEERIGLLNIKAWITYGSTQPGVLQDWLGNDYCEWRGVTCGMTISDTQRVIGIDLGGARYSSLGDLYLNASLFLPFKELNFLYLGDNKLAGCFENQGFQVLSSTLTKLKYLDLAFNKFNGTILSSLSGLSSLKLLIISGNMLTGSTNIKGLRMLEELYIDNITMTESILLQSLGALPSLKILSAGLNNLNVTIINQGLCKLKKLEELYLNSNNLEGLLPVCLGSLSSLRVLDVSANQFVGSIASGPLTHLTSLESLSISGNQFEIPASFKPLMNHSNLKAIDCSDNKLIAAETAASFQNFFPQLQLEYFSLSNCTSQGLKAEIPNFLYSQRHLRFLDLSYNGFCGMFPSWLFENNTGLEQIFLKNNSFAGPFLLPFHPNINLSDLVASNNNINDQIPTNTCLIFPKLEALVMSNNRLIGSVPSCLRNLVDLDLSNNQLSVVQLELLTFSSSLDNLILSNNNLDGQLLSPSVSNSSAIPNLYVLDISNNRFSGMLPSWIGNLTNLFEIDFSNNQFEGPIPQDFCKLQNLKFLDLSENNFSGFIPSCFSPPQISHILLHKNRLSGPLTPLFYNGSSMVTLDLAYNNFIGSIPNLIGNLSVLSVLNLKANRFHGELPIQLCMLKQLSILDVSQNKLSGPLPSCFGNLTFDGTRGKVFHSVHYYLETDLRDEDVGFTTKSRYYSYKGAILDFMSGIDLSCNKFMGEIPPEIGYLSEIIALNLSSNNLTGPIPATFSNLKQIESLDISHNNFTGAIPLQLTELIFLEVFSVAYNNLSGKTPERKNQFGTFDAHCYEGNPLLCGPPLLNSCSEAESPSQSVPNDSNGEGDKDAFMDMDVFYKTFRVCYLTAVLTTAAFLCINPYWRRRWFSFVECCIESCYYFVLGIWSS